ncbi:TPA: hypothetical protein QDA99_004233 [Burkholderia vietnamiensis]|nr:hypothetical protein [Burkholderia vietnamiensis]
MDRRSRRRRSCDGTPPARVITPMRVQRRIPPDDAIKSPNERMPTGATGRFAPATSRHPPLSRRTRCVLANTDSHDRFDLSRASIRRVRHVHFFSCRATHETSRATRRLMNRSTRRSTQAHSPIFHSGIPLFSGFFTTFSD